MWNQWARTLVVVALSCLAGESVYGQLRDVSNTKSVRITYDGRIYLRLPNFDVALNGTPTLPGYTEDDRARVIFRNNQGSFWDGNRFFLSPSYRYGMVTRNDRTQHYVGDWVGGPWTAGETVQRPGLVPQGNEAEAAMENRGAGVPLAVAPNRSPLPLPNLPPMPYPPKKIFPKVKVPKVLTEIEEAPSDAFLEPVPKVVK